MIKPPAWWGADVWVPRDLWVISDLWVVTPAKYYISMPTKKCQNILAFGKEFKKKLLPKADSVKSS